MKFRYGRRGALPLVLKSDMAAELGSPAELAEYVPPPCKNPLATVFAPVKTKGTSGLAKFADTRTGPETLIAPADPAELLEDTTPRKYSPAEKLVLIPNPICRRPFRLLRMMTLFEVVEPLKLAPLETLE